MYVLWLNFFLGSNFIFLCFKLIMIHYHIQKQRKIKFEPRIKLNHKSVCHILCPNLILCPKSECQNFTHYYWGGNNPCLYFKIILSIVFVLFFIILPVFIHLCVFGYHNLYSHVCHCFNSFEAVTGLSLRFEVAG